MAYVDGFVLAVPKQNLDAYKEMARKAADVWMELGALSYVESVADDVPLGEITSFPRAAQAKDDEVVIFSWATYKDRASRNEIVKNVMADPRMQGHEYKTVFDAKRMIFGGFEQFIER